MNFSINTAYIKKINPKRVTIIGSFLWLFLFFTASIKVKYNLGLKPFLFIILNYLFLFIGFILINNKVAISHKFFRVSKATIKKILVCLIILSVLGFVFRLVDKFVIRDIVIGNTTVANRRLLAAQSPSIFGIISAIITPFSFLPFFIYHFIKLKSRFLLILSGIIFFLPAFDNFILGSRSGIFIVIILFVINVFYFKLIKLTLLQCVVISIIAFFGITYTTKIFIERTKEFMVTDERAVNHVLTNAVYNFTLTPKDEARLNIINSKSDFIKLTKLTYINVAQYYCHGVFEFGYLMDNYDAPHYYGANMFGVIAKFCNLILGTNIDLQKIQDSPPRTGIYTTFFGPLYVDFGWLSPIFMFVFGILQSCVYNKVLKGNFKYIPLLFYFLIIDFFMPVINFIISAQGFYIISALLLFIVSYKFAVSKIYFKKNNGVKQYLRLFK